MSPRFQLELDRERYAPGETIKGTILVTEGGGSRILEALLEYKEETADYSEVSISIPSGPLHEGDLTAGTSFEFELPLPGDALPNYRSEHGELYWELDVLSDVAGRPDIHERRRIEVRPGEGLPIGALGESEVTAPALVDRPDSIASSRRPRRSRARGTPDLLHWVPRAFLAVGVVLLLVGTVLLVRKAQFVTTAERATGAVIDVSQETDSDGDVTYYPVVAFTTADGKEIRFKSSTGSSPASHSTGDRVEVLYDPDDPSDAELSGFFDLWLGPGIFLFIGTGFVLVPLFILRISRS